ncbi:MAG: formate dehydrogenase accessory sulfurtransferase FdhD [Bacteroidota bacterium]
MKTNKQITRISTQGVETITDQLAIESEYELILNGHKEYTFLCSPESLKHLTIGYLYAYEKIKSANDIKHLDIKNNEISVEFLSSSTVTISNKHEITFSIEKIREAMNELNQKGQIFHATGCTHIAGLLNERDIICHFEDISRHNAILKTLGYAIQHNIPLWNCALLLSCRITSSVIDLIAETPLNVLCSQSAVSSLAMDKAIKTGKSVLGFIRHNRMNLYTGNQRFI